MHAAVRCAVAIVVCGSFVVAASPAAGAPAPPVTYRPPVDVPVSDPFRPPATPYGPGNRGLEFATSPGMPVAAAADGVVVFAGVVAGRRWVTIRHEDGIRTTYGPLDGMLVTNGQRVTGGQSIGTAAGPLTFTARVGDAYVDPVSLFDGGPPRVHLIPDPLDQPPVRFHSGGAIPGADALVSALEWEFRHVEVMPKVAVVKTVFALADNEVDALTTWNDQRADCTPALWQPPPPDDRRFAVLVGGLGSSTTSAAIADVNTAALGYDAGDVVRFSYTGGRIPSDTAVSPELQRLPVHDYGPRDTVGDLEAAGHRLAELLVQMASAVPDGAAIDVFAHSQGGLVTRVALRELADERSDVLSHVHVVVTLGSPHHGADLAALVRAGDANPVDPGLFELVRSAADLPIAPDDPVVEQLAPGSAFLDELGREPLPDGVRVVSVAARGDAVVPSPRTRLDGATNVVVGVDGLSAHDRLPASGAANHEIGLALAGRGPACQSAGEAMFDTAEGTLIQGFEDFATAELGD